MLARPPLQSETVAPATNVALPIVVDESLVHPFAYWNQSIQRGMRYNQELYTFFRTYPAGDRLQAYSVGCEYAEQGIRVCITVSKMGYAVWFSLRSPLPMSLG